MFANLLTYIVVSSNIFLSVLCQDSVSIRLTLPDNLPANKSLGDISSMSPAIPAPPAGSGGYFRVIMNPDKFASDRFTIIKSTTELITKVAIDRDEVCNGLSCCDMLLCEHNFTVFIYPNSRSYKKVTITLVIADSNDNAPHIRAENITLPESAAIGSRRPLLTASDKDSTSNGVVKYSITDPTGTFGLYMISPTRPTLEVLKKLDADDIARREFVLTYSAEDGGTPPKIGSTKLYVTVLDENDNPPRFTRSSGIKYINENVTIGTEIYRFNATDNDVGEENKRITFRLDTIHSLPERIAGQKFEVVSTTGAVVVRNQLDYDDNTQRSFTLVVEATDHGSPQRSSSATLTVGLLNVNDNPPKIEVTNSEPLEESKSTEQRVRTISVSDLDQQNSIKVSCRLVNSPGFAIKTITQQHLFDIVTTRLFDYETTPNVNITIICSDEQPPYRTSNRTITIPVVDINDHSPVFSRTSYTKEISEDSPVNSEVITVNATDRDSGNLGKIRYSLDAQGQRWFHIDPKNGIIFVNKSLDRETSSQIEFKVIASDLGLPPKTATASVKIVVTDVNDIAPYLISPKAINVVENARPGTVITQVRFGDGDEGKNGQVDFRLSPDAKEALKYFNVTADGKVIVARSIDREQIIKDNPTKEGKLYLDFDAQDRGTPTLRSTVSLIVIILDVNDNAPMLVNPSNYSTLGNTVFSNSKYNTTVGILRAEDPDQNRNGTVLYDIIDTNGTGMFRIESDTGRIYSSWKYPSQPGHGLYHLRIRLSDKGNPPLSSEASLFILVGPPTSAKVAGMSNIIILVLILVASIAIVIALIMAILWARSRSKRNSSGPRSPDYAEYDPAVKKARSMGSDSVSNMDMVSGLAVDPLGDSASTIVRSKTPSRISQYVDYVIPYPMATPVSKRDSRSPQSMEASYSSQIRTFGHQSPPAQSFAMENFATVGRPGATSPASSYQHRSGAFGNAHLLPEMFEDDPRQSELSYDDSGKGGSVDDLGRFIIGQHAPSNVAMSNLYPLQHNQPHRVSLRGHPGGPGGTLAGAEATLC